MKPIEVVNDRGWIGIALPIQKHEVREDVLWILAGGEYGGRSEGALVGYPLRWRTDRAPVAFGKHTGEIAIVNRERRLDGFTSMLAEAFGMPLPGPLAEITDLYAEEHDGDPETVLSARVTTRLILPGPRGSAGPEGEFYFVVDLANAVLRLDEREPGSGHALVDALVRGRAGRSANSASGTL